MKKVSVIIPAYNKADFTVRSVESVLGQTYQNIEIVVVDDGSTDDTLKKLEPLKNRIKLIAKTNGGASHARNVGIDESSGQYMAFLDCDDIYYKDKIEKTVYCLESEEDIGFVSTSINKIDANDKVVSKSPSPPTEPSGWIFSYLIQDNSIWNSTIIAKRECFDKVGGFDEKVFIPADWDMWIRLSKHYKAGYVDERLTGYRVSDNYTFSNIDKGLKESLYLVDKYISQGYYTSKKQLKRSKSNIYYTYAKYNGAVKEFATSRSLFWKSLLSDLSNPRTPTIMFSLFLARFNPNLLNNILKKRLSFNQ